MASREELTGVDARVGLAPVGISGTSVVTVVVRVSRASVVRVGAGVVRHLDSM